MKFLSNFQYPSEMMAVITTGEGGFDKLEYRKTTVPQLAKGEVLIKVLAAGINNTDINTRLGWYSRAVTMATDKTIDDANAKDGQGGWAGETPFPLIQGTDCCGIIVACENYDDSDLLGKRVLVRACMRPKGFSSFEMTWMASNFDGAFADYCAVPATEVFAVDCDWRDEELATIPCAYATAETMLERANCDAKDRVIITGASGGVGSAAIQLAKRRSATVIGITSQDKKQDILALGCDEVFLRGDPLDQLLADDKATIIIDNVAGENFGMMLKCLAAGGRYATSGAIAGPIVSLDMRDLYLNDITLIGSTAWDEAVFGNLIRYIEKGEIKPILAASYPLSDIVEAQKFFMEKSHIGNVVLVPSA